MISLLEYMKIVEAALPQMKYCTKCKQDLSLNMFGKNKSTKDKLHYICKSCVIESNKKTSEKNQENFHLIKDSLPGTKFCSGCNTKKPIKEFGKKKM